MAADWRPALSPPERLPFRRVQNIAYLGRKGELWIEREQDGWGRLTNPATGVDAECVNASDSKRRREPRSGTIGSVVVFLVTTPPDAARLDFLDQEDGIRWRSKRSLPSFFRRVASEGGVHVLLCMRDRFFRSL